MKFFSVLSNMYRLDGGAMFGNAPKTLWESWIPADDLNRIRLATRALLVTVEDHVLLFEAGIGAYMEPKYRERYGVEGSENALLESLVQRGVSHTDVTDIILSHLHFDHAGGLLSAWQEGREPELLFPNAKFYVSEKAWERATYPHVRDKTSFPSILAHHLEHSGRLVLLQPEDVLSYGALQVDFFNSEGHTPGMLCSDLHWEEGRMVFAADLIPGKTWVHLPISMGYDRYPELLINEKRALLASLAGDDGWIFYTHDPEIAASKVQADEEHQTYVPVAAQASLELTA